MAYEGTITDDFISGTMEYQREGGGSSSRTTAWKCPALNCLIF